MKDFAFEMEDSPIYTTNPPPLHPKSQYWYKKTCHKHRLWQVFFVREGCVGGVAAA